MATLYGSTYRRSLADPLSGYSLSVSVRGPGVSSRLPVTCVIIRGLSPDSHTNPYEANYSLSAYSHCGRERAQ